MEKGELTWDEPQVITQFRQEHGWVTDAAPEDATAKDEVAKPAQKVTCNNTDLTVSYQSRGPMLLIPKCMQTHRRSYNSHMWPRETHLYICFLKDGG